MHLAPRKAGRGSAQKPSPAAFLPPHLPSKPAEIYTARRGVAPRRAARHPMCAFAAQNTSALCIETNASRWFVLPLIH